MKKIFIVLILFWLAGCAQLQKFTKEPKVDIKKVEVVKFSVEELVLRPILIITNENPIDIPVNAMNYNLSLGQEQVFSTSNTPIGNLPSKKPTEVALDIVVGKSSINAVKKLLTENDTVPWQMKGNVDFKLFSIPFEQSGKIGLPKIKNIQLNIDEASLKKVALNLSLEVNNPNDFVFPLNPISINCNSNNKTLLNTKVDLPTLVQGINKVNIPLTLDMTVIIKNAFQAIQNPKTMLNFNVTSADFQKSFQHEFDARSMLK